MGLMKKLKCLIGFHDWLYSCGYVDYKYMKIFTCQDCGKEEFEPAER